MEIKVKILRKEAKIPAFGSIESAGCDLYACMCDDLSKMYNDPNNGKWYYIIKPFKTVLIPTGLAFALPIGYFAGIFARSGKAVKEDLVPANCVGVCDSDFRGEYIVAIHNNGDTVRMVEVGERIAQMIVMAYSPLEFNVVDELPETARNASAFGSTGKY